MRRALLPLALLLIWPAAADAATVKVVNCVPALDPVARSATFEARLRASRGSDRMQVRFTLQVRDDGTAMRWRKVVAPGFEQWLTSAAGVRKYSYSRTIQNLTAPASYRTIVRFRWLDEDGLVLRSTRATSSACRQPDMRPDLEPVRVETAPGPDADTRTYRVTVRNGGRTAAGAFDVALGDAVQRVTALAAGAQQVVTFTGPPCTADTRLTVDPADAVDERDEDDNVLVAPCQP
jgi:CARDB